MAQGDLEYTPEEIAKFKKLGIPVPGQTPAHVPPPPSKAEMEKQKSTAQKIRDFFGMGQGDTSKYEK